MRGERDLVFLVRLLHAGGLEVFQDHLRRSPCSSPSFGFRLAVDQLVVLIDAEHAVRREALDGERPGDADLLACLRRACRRDIRIRPWRRWRRRSPSGGRCAAATIRRAASSAAAGHLSSASRGISHSSHFCFSAALSCSRSGSSVCLELLPDHVDFGVVGDGFECDVRHALVDEALADVAVGRGLGRNRVRDFGFLQLAVLAVGEQVVGIASAHDAGAS